MKSLNNLSLKAKLLIILLLVGIVPFGLGALISIESASSSLEKQAFNQLESIKAIKKSQVENYFKERHGDMNVLMETVAAIRAESINKLVAVRENKKQSIVSYLHTMETQLVSMASAPSTITAVKEMSAAYQAVSVDNKSNANTLREAQSSLLNFYNNAFLSKYQEVNEKPIDAQSWIKGLSIEGLVLQANYIANNPNPLGEKSNLVGASNDRSRWTKLHETYHPRLKSIQASFGYYDIFFVNLQGDVVYTVFKELDFATNLKTGTWKDTGLSQAWKKSLKLQAGQAFTEDFAPYTPSYEAPAGFMASPVFDGNKRVGSVVVQIPLDKITQTMSERAGLGKTGESYLVGPDNLMRSDSYHSPETHSVSASFNNPEKGSVHTKSVQMALAGKTGVEMVTDYNGSLVVSAFAPLNVVGLKWALMSEVDVAEMFVPQSEDSDKDFYQTYIEKYGYYDLFLIDPDGYVFYSAAKEADYQTNMVSGKYADSNLGQLVQRVMKTGEFGIADFAPYAPSNNDPASFIAQPVMHKGKVSMVVAIQLPLEAINDIMNNREGMGKTGESYLIGQDKLMRSDSFLHPEIHSVKASFAQPSVGKVDTETARLALQGQSGSVITLDFNNTPVLSSYTRIDVGDGITWGMLAEIDEDEAFASVYALQTMMWIIATVVILLLVVIAMMVARSITRPVQALMNTMTLVQTSGEFNHRITVNSADEIGRMGSSFNEMLNGVQSTINDTNDVLAGIAKGDFSKRITADLKGDLLRLKQGVNDSSESVEFMMNELGIVMDALYHGDFSVKMSEKVDGAFRQQVDQAMASIQMIIADINAAMQQMNDGDFDGRVSVEARGALAIMKENVNDSLARMAHAVGAISDVISAQAEGDLTKALPAGTFKGQLHDLKNAINYSAAKMKDVVAQAIEASNIVSGAADEVSRGSYDLSQRVQQQAAALEQTSATMDEMNAAVQGNTQNANQATKVASEVQSKANQGVAVMSQTLDAMSAIQESSHKIADIVTLIDGIAFQTNLLALNAAVEAARAGDHGRGFAVVAGEVRSLAQKSADAAKDINALISESVTRIDQGTRLAKESGEMLDTINASVEEVTKMIGQIALASSQQAEGISQVHQSITQIDQVTQQNAALVEETSASAESLTEQADNLKKGMAFFTIDGVNQAKPAVNKRSSQPAKKLAAPAPKASLPNRSSTQASSKSNGEEWGEF